MGPEPEIQGYALVTVHTSDMQTARSFYQDTLGLEERDYDANAGKAVFAVPGGPDLGVHVWNSWCKEADGRPPGTVSGVILSVRDASGLADRVADGGGRITGEIQPRKWADGRPAGFVADPDGNEFIIVDAGE